MHVKYTDSFFKSIKTIINRQRWYWKVWDFIRYDLPKGIYNIFYFWGVIWRFRSWDSSFQLKILARSLEPLVKNIEGGYEVEETRLKKVESIKRAIEILNRQADDDYVSLAEQNLGYEVNLEYGVFGIANQEDEPIEIKEANAKIFDLAKDLEDKEWVELWQIIKGQDHSHFVMYYDKAKHANPNLDQDIWAKWFNGTGMKGWWN